jgi:hypothetical protein
VIRILICTLVWPLAVCVGQLSSTVSLSNGVQLRIATSSTSLKVKLEPASGNSFYHVFRDENDLAVFAYAIQVDRTPDGEQFRISAKPATTEFAARFPNADAGKPTPTLSTVLESPLLTSGGQFTVDIPTNPGLAENVTDTIQIQVNQRGAPVSEADTQAAKVRFAGLKVSINGRLSSTNGSSTVVQGRYAMLYVPGRGAYFFSEEPVTRRAFLHAGVVTRNTLQFTLDNVEYTCKSDSPILVHSDEGQLWVYHDPNYKPAGNWTRDSNSSGSSDQFFTAASDTLDWWLP